MPLEVGSLPIRPPPRKGPLAAHARDNWLQNIRGSKAIPITRAVSNAVFTNSYERDIWAFPLQLVCSSC
jgi:hypothetical protein